MSRLADFFRAMAENDQDFINDPQNRKILAMFEIIKEQTRIREWNKQAECEHDPEEICAYVDNNLNRKERERIEEIISACDNCFELFFQLKDLGWETIKTPEKRKNSVPIKAKIFAPFGFGTGMMSGFVAAAIIILLILPEPQQIIPAKNSYGLLLTGNETEADNLFFQALKEKERGNSEKASELLEQFLEKNPEVAEAEYELAKIYKEQKKPKSARVHFEKYLNLTQKIKEELEQKRQEAVNELNN